MKKQKDIIGYEGLYRITKRGFVIRYPRKKRLNGGGEIMLPEMQVAINMNGAYYPSVTLNKNGKQKTFYMHRLMAIHFIPNNNILQKLEVNHKNKNTQDYSIKNLEWCTRSENVKHAKNILERTAVGAVRQKKKKNVR